MDQRRASGIALALIIFAACGKNAATGVGAHGGGTPSANDAGADGASLDGSPSPGDASPPVLDAGPPVMASTISQFGITWTLDGPHLVGQFVNGDYWVEGPVTITSVSPAPAADRNGSVVNPPIADGQGYDGRGNSYNPQHRATFPLTLSGVSSLVSSISHPASTCTLGGGSPGYPTYDGDCQGGPIKTQAVLTVVSSPPAPGSFRPPYAASAYKPFFLASNVDLGLLPRLPKPASAPSEDVILRHVERPWIDHLLDWDLQLACATENMYCYGREIGGRVQDVALYLLLDSPAQQTLALRFIQLGIDNYGIVKNGHVWTADGGHMNGRKTPIVLAGLLLGDAGMKSPGDVSGEDQQTYLGANKKALWGRACTSCYLNSGCTDTSCGAKDCRDPAGLIDGCEDYRNCCTSLVWPGQALAIRMLHGKSAWNHDPFFDYVDRWMGGDVGGGGAGDAYSTFAKDMWTQYRSTAP